MPGQCDCTRCLKETLGSERMARMVTSGKLHDTEKVIANMKSELDEHIEDNYRLVESLANLKAQETLTNCDKSPNETRNIENSEVDRSKWATFSEAASWLKMSVRSLRRYLAEFGLESHKFAGDRKKYLAWWDLRQLAHRSGQLVFGW